MKLKKTAFIIIRVTELEKKLLKNKAKKSKERFSDFIRLTLGLK